MNRNVEKQKALLLLTDEQWTALYIAGITNQSPDLRPHFEQYVADNEYPPFVEGVGGRFEIVRPWYVDDDSFTRSNSVRIEFADYEGDPITYRLRYQTKEDQQKTARAIINALGLQFTPKKDRPNNDY